MTNQAEENCLANNSTIMDHLSSDLTMLDYCTHFAGMRSKSRARTLLFVSGDWRRQEHGVPPDWIESSAKARKMQGIQGLSPSIGCVEFQGKRMISAEESSFFALPVRESLTKHSICPGFIISNP